MKIMRDDYSIGIVPILKKDGEFYTFIVKHIGGHWGFPKGHPIDGENQLETAVRELKEETNLDASNLLSDKMLREEYSFFIGDDIVNKKVDYFIIEVSNLQSIILDPNEIADGKLLIIKDALNYLSFKESKKVCVDAIDILSTC